MFALQEPHAGNVGRVHEWKPVMWMECAVRAPGTRQRAPNKGRQIEFLIRVDKLTHFYWFANIPRPFLLPRRHPPNERRRRPSMQWICYGRSHYSNLAAAVNMHVGLFYNSNRNLLHAYSVVARAKFLYTACAFLTCFSQAKTVGGSLQLFIQTEEERVQKIPGGTQCQ